MNQDDNEIEQEEAKLKIIQDEFRSGIETVKKFNPSVTFYGSTQMSENTEYYTKVRNLTYKISKELGYAILSGGGPGIMEAANRGAYEAGGKSIGLTIKLPHEQFTNKYVTDEIPFRYFFTRQLSMLYATEVCIFCPGGFGTLNELFEILTLQQTNKIGKIPIILFGSDFWNPIVETFKKILSEEYKTIAKEDLNLFVVKDNEDEIFEIIKNSRIRDGKDALN